MAALPTYLPLAEAARKYGLDESRIRALVESGAIKAAMIGETIVVSESDAQGGGNPLRKEDLPEYKAVKHLKGTGIGVGEASEKYGVGFSTIFRWYQKGLIDEVERVTVQGGEKIFLDECDVAYCVAIYRKIGGRAAEYLIKMGFPTSLKLALSS
jgi:hypothetical protein